MGTSTSKDYHNVATSLSPKEFTKIQKFLQKEFPWIDSIAESMLITDMQKADNPIVCANEDFQRMTQYSKEEVLGFNCRFLQGKHTNHNTVAKIKEAVVQGTELEVEILNYRKDGTPFLNNFLLVPLRIHKSKPNVVSHFLAIQKDVTYLLRDDDPTRWKPAQIAIWLERAGYGEFVHCFIENEVHGKAFLAMDMEGLARIGISDSSIQLKLAQLIQLLATEGPGFVYELEEPITRLHESTESAGVSTSDSVALESSESSANLSADYQEVTDDAGIFREADLYQPRQTAYWRRKSTVLLSGTTDGLNTEELMKRMNFESSQGEKDSAILFSCCVYNMLDDRKESESIDLQCSHKGLLFIFKQQLKEHFKLPTNFKLYILVDARWELILTQQDFNHAVSSRSDKHGFVRVVKLSQDKIQNYKSLLPFKLDVDQGEDNDYSAFFSSKIGLSLLVPIERIEQRALLFDVLHRSRSNYDIFLEATTNIWDPLSAIEVKVGHCFVIPCSCSGELMIPDKFLTTFAYKQKCKTLLEQEAVKNGGELSLGNCFLLQCGESFVALCVFYRLNRKKDVITPYSYYTGLRNLMQATDKYNKSVSTSSPAIISSLAPHHASKRYPIRRLLLPVSFENDNLTSDIGKFAVQLGVTLDSFARWKHCMKKKSLGCESYRSSMPRYERRLQRKAIKLDTKHKQKMFLKHLASGDICSRGLLEDEELSWLIEASSYIGDPNSVFSNNRRLQRLANVAISALVTRKYFNTGEQFQMKLRAAITENKTCLDWLLKIAAAGSISLCPTIPYDSLQYRVRFANGGGSTLLRATLVHSDKDYETVAVKVFNDNNTRPEILHEISLMSLLKHSNVLPVYYWGNCTWEERASLFSVSPFAERRSLFHVIEKNPIDFDIPMRIKVFNQCMEGLTYLHSLFLVHRDIKSLNILITTDYHVYIGDIGSTRILEEKLVTNSGTVCWMPPELLSGGTYNQKSDIYSMGMVLYEIIENKTPFFGVSTQDVPAKVVRGERPPLSNISKEWKKLLQAMWHPKANKRPSALEVLDTVKTLSSTLFFDTQ